MKKLFALFLSLTMVLSLAACGGGNATEAPKEETSAPTETPAAPTEAEMTAWEKSSNIFATDETDEELYQQAIAEGGTVTLYSISSRCGKVADAFMAKYPELECIAFDISTNELLEKVTREHEAGQR